MDRLEEKLSKFAAVEKDVPLSSMTTLRIGGIAKYVVYPETDVALDSILRLLKKNNVPWKFLGKGSDILASDDPYDGVIIRLDREYNHSYFQDCMVTAQAGCSLVVLAYDAMKHGLSGLEFACGIPGTVGGAIYMNAGAYRSSMADVITEVFIYAHGKFEWIPASHCKFGYRSSIFQEHPGWVILGCRMNLKPKDREEISDLMDDRRARRIASQPLEYPSCGSVFRNPPGVNAWELIDGIGYRGKSLGGAYVSDKHCNFIVNRDHASAKDFLALVEEIQQKVKEKYDISLQMEMEKFNWQEK